MQRLQSGSSQYTDVCYISHPSSLHLCSLILFLFPVTFEPLTLPFVAPILSCDRAKKEVLEILNIKKKQKLGLFILFYCSIPQYYICVILKIYYPFVLKKQKKKKISYYLVYWG